ncbi:hypothetical protein [Aliigemmobacter aestuarii]|nr:hypothetical protein [Gemmobacter aestuarii]
MAPDGAVQPDGEHMTGKGMQSIAYFLLLALIFYVGTLGAS